MTILDKHYYHIATKAARIQEQHHFLKQSVNQGTILDGILSQCKFKCSVNDTQLQSTIDKLMSLTASCILDLLLIYYNNW